MAAWPAAGRSAANGHRDRPSGSDASCADVGAIAVPSGAIADALGRVISPAGMVTIDAVMPRVTGSLSFMDTDMTVGDISVMGNFDVKRCF